MTNMGEIFLLGMDQILALLIVSGLLSFSGWIIFTIRAIKLGAQLSSSAIFIVVLLILWRVFQLNLDFGLVLTRFLLVFDSVLDAFLNVCALYSAHTFKNASLYAF